MTLDEALAYLDAGSDDPDFVLDADHVSGYLGVRRGDTTRYECSYILWVEGAGTTLRTDRCVDAEQVRAILDLRGRGCGDIEQGWTPGRIHRSWLEGRV
jgi:hypothetical protein